jgi:hypothetical protein
MLKLKLLPHHINDEFRILVLGKSGLAAGGLLYCEANGMSYLKIILALPYPWAHKSMAIHMYVTGTL